MTSKERIIQKSLELLEGKEHGLRYGELIQKLSEELPGIPKNTLTGTIWNLEVKIPKQVFKPARGLYLLRKFVDSPTAPGPKLPVTTKVKEEDFYEPFADWLINELEECTKAISVGGNLFKDKWGTPDVVGIREPKKSDIVKFPTEIISAEVKLDTYSLITAFGQACSYRIFSHKSYLVVPSSSPEEDLARLDTLARIFGIGLILFDSVKPSTPGFDIRVRAVKNEPDMFYVNRYMKLVEDELFA